MADRDRRSGNKGPKTTLPGGVPPAPTPPHPQNSPKTTLKGVPPAQVPEKQPSNEPSESEDEDWVVSFNEDGSVTEERSSDSSSSGISSSVLDEKVIARGRSKAGSTRSGRGVDDDGLGPGVMVYKYELIKLLGRGGMGSVYMAHDTSQP